MELKYKEKIIAEIDSYGLTIADLTSEELKDFDDNYEAYQNGLILDGIYVTIVEKGYNKMGQN